ncbi:hypothetical protein BGP_6638 [Beggiatoa sp. PS]|nr:hypothetical protein BGP_6638 [Beggiatoa sp. PS]
MTVNGIQDAFTWAKEKGQFGDNCPLVVIVVAHGTDNELILSNTERFSAKEFKKNSG